MVMHKSSTSFNRTQVSKSGAQSDVSICQIPVADWPRLAGSFCPGSGPSPAQAWQNQCLQEGEGGSAGAEKTRGFFSRFGNEAR